MSVPTSVIITFEHLKVIYTNELGYICIIDDLPFEKYDEIIQNYFKISGKLEQILIKQNGKSTLSSVIPSLQELLNNLSQTQEIIIQRVINQAKPSFIRIMIGSKGNNKAYRISKKESILPRLKSVPTNTDKDKKTPENIIFDSHKINDLEIAKIEMKQIRDLEYLCEFLKEQVNVRLLFKHKLTCIKLVVDFIENTDGIAYFSKFRFYEIESSVKAKRSEEYKTTCNGIFCKKENIGFMAAIQKFIDYKGIVENYCIKGLDKMISSHVVDAYAKEAKPKVYSPLLTNKLVEFTPNRNELVKVCNYCYILYKIYQNKRNIIKANGPTGLDGRLLKLTEIGWEEWTKQDLEPLFKLLNPSRLELDRKESLPSSKYFGYIPVLSTNQEKRRAINLVQIKKLKKKKKQKHTVNISQVYFDEIKRRSSEIEQLKKKKNKMLLALSH